MTSDTDSSGDPDSARRGRTDSLRPNQPTGTGTYLDPGQAKARLPVTMVTDWITIDILVQALWLGCRCTFELSLCCKTDQSPACPSCRLNKSRSAVGGVKVQRARYPNHLADVGPRGVSAIVYTFVVEDARGVDAVQARSPLAKNSDKDTLTRCLHDVSP